MAVTVAFRLRPRPDGVEVALRAVRRGFEDARTVRPRSRRARLFQRLGDPTDLLDIGEWEAPGAVEAYVRSPLFAEVAAVAEVPPRVEYYESLRSLEWFSRSAAVAACATIVASPATAATVAAYLREESFQAVSAMPGLCYHEVNRAVDDPSHFLTVHGWSTLADLDRFRAGVGPRLRAAEADLGAVVDLFAGVVVAEYRVPTPTASWPERP